MNATKFSLFIHPGCLCDVFKGSRTWRLLGVVEVNITWSSTCTRPKYLHGVVLKFRGKFIFRNLYPAVCWRRQCTYECLFLLLYCPNFMNINWKSYLQIRLTLWETSISSGCLNWRCWGAVWTAERRSDRNLDAGLFSRSSSPIYRRRNTPSETILLLSSLVSLLVENKRLKPSETSVTVPQSTNVDFPKAVVLHQHRCEDLKFAQNISLSIVTQLHC
jgi:hypothetical protein